MNINKFFRLASDEGISVSEVSCTKSSSLSISVFKKEIVNYSVDNSIKISARGIYNDKMGFVSTYKDNADTAAYLVEKLKEGASLSESEDLPIIFKGSPKYRKKNVYSANLEQWSVDEIIKTLFLIEEKLYAADPRVNDVEVEFSKTASSNVFGNSYGLDLKTKSNYFTVFANVVIKDGDEIKSSYDIFLNNDPQKFDIDEFVKKIVSSGIEKLHGESIKPKAYKAVFSNDAVSDLLSALLSNLSSEEIQKHSSLFEGKLNEQVLSSKITIEEKPLANNIFYQYFDDEGVATQNKVLFKNGVLKTYLYNLVTAQKDNVETTGNASRNGSKMGIGFNNIFLKPGRLTEEELIAKVGNGVYVSSITGLHAGLNSKSGDFSLQAEGFHIVDGKKDKALTLITVSGNLFKLFNDVIAVGNNAKLLLNASTVPSVAFRNIKVSAE